MSHALLRGHAPRFRLGEVVATPGALDALSRHPNFLHQIVGRHAQCDWGEVADEDRRANDRALVYRERLLSAYTTPEGVRVWVLTEADRSVTTMLLPSEY